MFKYSTIWLISMQSDIKVNPNRESYISARSLLNLSNELWKNDRMHGFAKHFYIFPNQF